ncbi:MAG: GTP-binding protein [Lachnospiraceae bacterium]|nr:GTP-binding protein [Lachnospiraceae bacterium]
MLREIPVYIVTGFLESGKTTFLRDILSDDEFTEGQKALLILCEEGEEEYDEKLLAGMNIDIITVEDEKDFTPEFLTDCQKHYQPKRIFIEMNGMWDAKWMFEEGLPGRMAIAQVITLVDGSTFGVYLNNMRGILSNLFTYTEMVIFNRCTPEMELHSWRRAVRGVNQGAMIYFEDEEGDPIDPGMEEPPYDLNAEVIQIDDIDYGLWYLDANETPDRYDGKKVRFRGKVMKSRRFGDGIFVPGRNVMTCCADDIRFMGYICKAEFEPLLKSREWIWITAKIKYEYRKEYGQKGPVLYAESYELTGAPETDTVYFN